MQFLTDIRDKMFVFLFFTFGNKNLQYIVQQQIAEMIIFFHVKNNQKEIITFSSTIKRKNKQTSKLRKEEFISDELHWTLVQNSGLYYKTKIALWSTTGNTSAHFRHIALQ